GQLTALGPELLDERNEHGDEGVGFFRRKETHALSLRRLAVNSTREARSPITPARFVVVAGLSGAGKSQAMKSFEDLGFYCADNLPPALLADLVRLVQSAGIERVALALDVRVGGPFGDALA